MLAPPSQPLILTPFSLRYNASLATLIAGAVTITSSFIIFFAMREKKRYHYHGVTQMPTISLTGSYYPSNIIFTLGLHLMALFLAHFITSLYITCDTELRSGKAEVSASSLSTLHHWNIRLWRIGIACAIFLALTGSVALTMNEGVHSTFAFLMFLCAILHMYVYYYKYMKHVDHHDILQTQLVQLAMFIVLPLNFIIMLIAFLVHISCTSYSCTAFVVHAQPLMEFTTVIGLSLYIYVLRSEVDSYCIVLAPSNAVQLRVCGRPIE